MQENKIIGLILSAGYSKRMGKFKPLLNYNGKSFLLNIIEKTAPVCDQIIIVTGHRAEDVENHIREKTERNYNKILTIKNNSFSCGMFSSLQTGITFCENADWILYHFVDQPALPHQFYPGFIEQIDNSHDWIQPVNNERKGHPIIFGKRVIEVVLKANTNSNLREITKEGLRKKFWECSYEEIFLDIDTTDDYKKLTNGD